MVMQSDSLMLPQYEECIKDCEKAVERGRELRSDFKMIAKALTRKGTALVKMAKCSKDYEPAIEAFQKALTEHRNPDTLKKLNDAEKAKKDLEQQEYFDPKLADEEREKGVCPRNWTCLIYSCFCSNDLCGLDSRVTIIFYLVSLFICFCKGLCM